MYVVRYRCIPLFSRSRRVCQRAEKYRTLQEALREAQARKAWVLPNGQHFVRGAVTVTLG